MKRNLIFALTSLMSIAPMASIANNAPILSTEAIDLVSNVTCDSIFYKGIAKFDEEIDANPNCLDLYMGKMEAMVAKKNFEAVYVTANKVIELSQFNNNHWLNQQGQPVKNGFEAFARISDFVTELSDAGQNGYAIALINKLVSAYPKQNAFKKCMADYLYNNGKHSDAYTLYDAIADDYKDDMKFVNIMAGLYAEHHNIEKMNAMCAILEASLDNEYKQCAEKIRYDYAVLDVDFKKIETYVRKNSKVVDQLNARFVEGDQTLTLEELSYVYFGHACNKKGCTPLWEETDQAQSLYESGYYAECFSLCEQALAKHPASLAANALAYKSLREMNGMDPKVENFRLRSSQLARMISSTARGEDQTYKILWQDDEDAFVEYYLSSADRDSSEFANPSYFAENVK